MPLFPTHLYLTSKSKYTHTYIHIYIAALKLQQSHQKGHEKSASIIDSPNPRTSAFLLIIPVALSIHFLTHRMISCAVQPSSASQKEHLTSQVNAPQLPETDPIFNLSLDPSYPFGSEAANLEYSMLTAILGNPSPPGPSDENSRLGHPSVETNPQAAINNTYPQFANPGWPAPPPPPPPPQPTSQQLVPSQGRSPAITPSFLHQPSSDSPSTYTNTTAYRPSLGQTQSINSGSFHSPTSAASMHPTSSLPTIHQPQAQLHYSQPAWSDTNSHQQTMTEMTKPQTADSTYIHPQPSSSALPYANDAQSRGSQPQMHGLPPLSPPPSNSSPGTPGETIFPYQANQRAQSHSDSTRQRPVVRSRPSHLHQTPQWGFSNSSDSRTQYGSKSHVASTFGDMQDKFASSVYDTVTKPYDYTQGYHVLMRFLQERHVSVYSTLSKVLTRFRFDKNDILRVVRALAIVRPSLIALQMPLTEEDEIFVEKCFQRSLIVRKFFSLLNHTY